MRQLPVGLEERVHVVDGVLVHLIKYLPGFILASEQEDPILKLADLVFLGILLVQLELDGAEAVDREAVFAFLADYFPRRRLLRPLMQVLIICDQHAVVVEFEFSADFSRDVHDLDGLRGVYDSVSWFF